jgi:hypothetical protein
VRFVLFAAAPSSHFGQDALNLDLVISLAFAPTLTASLPALIFSVKTLPWY